VAKLFHLPSQRATTVGSSAEGAEDAGGATASPRKLFWAKCGRNWVKLANLGKIWTKFGKIGKFGQNLDKICAKMIKIWAKSKSRIPKNIRSPMAMVGGLKMQSV